jgi:hypothetical protein
MMEFLDVLKEFHLDYKVIAMVLAGGFFAKTYFKWNHIHIGKFRMALTDAWKTLMIGSFFVSLYIGITFLVQGFPKEIWLDVFYSYIFTTSFYELLLQPFVKMIKKKFGDEEPKP